MLSFPEQLYLPTAYDYAVGIAPRRYYENDDATFTGFTASVLSPTVPANLVLHLTHAFLTCGTDAAGAELVIILELRRFQEGLIAGNFLVSQDRGNGVGSHEALGGLVDLWLLPGESVQGFAQKNGAVQSFRINMILSGFLLPRANIQSG